MASQHSEIVASVHSGEIEKIKALLQANPSLASAKDERGVSALMHAYYRGRRDIAEVILNSRTELDIFEAAASGRADTVSEILERDQTQAQAWSADGFTALHFAAFFNQPMVARELVRRGAEVATVSMNPMEVTPLHSAAAAHATEIVRMLVESEAPVNAKQHGGWTALHAAADNGDLEMIKILLQNGADRLAQNDDGKTPAQIAQLKGRDQALQLLSVA
ncbi:MAG TPA: ankyrin repeat domain-containing protein [Terriglobales bacterium]|nr:ankyrin repeat domain-containing protein [Terriglobales bacterium]